MTPEFVGLSYSPWSIRALWALRAQGVEFRYRRYTIMLGEPMLRLRLRQPFRFASVPVLFTSDGALTDSFDIAVWAAEHATTSSLMPADRMEGIRDWNGCANEIMSAGRARTTRLCALDPDALLDTVPAPLDKLGPLTTMIGRSGASYVLRKYQSRTVDDATIDAAIRAGLTRLRAALGRRATIFDDFSYADVTMAVAFQFVAPVPDDVIRVGPRSRKHWNHPEIAAEFEDLLKWRNGIFERFPSR